MILKWIEINTFIQISLTLIIVLSLLNCIFNSKNILALSSKILKNGCPTNISNLLRNSLLYTLSHGWKLPNSQLLIPSVDYLAKLKRCTCRMTLSNSVLTTIVNRSLQAIDCYPNSRVLQLNFKLSICSNSDNSWLLLSINRLLK